ncbi:MAG: YaiI/YqxD family protein [Syntrophomonas sp.]
MKILVDADACPVKNIIEKMAEDYQLPVLMVCNPSHMIKSSYAQILVVDGSSQAVDIAIVNRTEPGDIIVTQDYGLASLVLAKKAAAIHPSGKIYNAENIDELLMQRFVNFKARQARLKVSNPKKRRSSDDEHFQINFERMLKNRLGN